MELPRVPWVSYLFGVSTGLRWFFCGGSIGLPCNLGRTPMGLVLPWESHGTSVGGASLVPPWEVHGTSMGFP